MRLPAAVLDHLVVAAYTLDQGMAYVRDRLGVPMTGGGVHTAMGTHNRVLKLGHGQYLEVIAIDPKGRRPDSPRWFNLDDSGLQSGLKIRPRLITWVARTDAIDTLAPGICNRHVQVRPMQRDSLRWRFGFTDDGSMPGDGLIPHLIQWESDIHPTEKMEDAACRLLNLEGAHIDPPSVQRVVSSMGLDHAITVHPVSKQRPPGLLAKIKTPIGVVVLD
ncbi:VOC family protein [uncultured Desulfosarcina sp.]|uniref:VOC family protein n=1 Tax=uncultured Desulfosarcina sp. TaxID=218289 RepID=UPI0029C61320|nr:VOC family protein [uncultured Desulfosarcina sp.]